MPIVYCVYYYYLWKWYSSPSMFCARYIFLFDWIHSLIGGGMIVFISTVADYSTIFHLDSRSPHRWITVHSLLFAGAMHSSSYVLCQSHKPTLRHTTTHAHNHFFLDVSISAITSMHNLPWFVFTNACKNDANIVMSSWTFSTFSLVQFRCLWGFFNDDQVIKSS